MGNTSFFNSTGATATAEDSIDTSVTAAEAAQTAAEAAQTAAETAQSASETAKTASESAQTSAESARDTALVYRNTAETHKNDAETAKTASEAARDLAEGYRDTAETHKDNAATSATTASTKATEASTSAASAASSLSSFQGQYSTGATDPTTNLDAGDLFFNTTDDTFKVYSGSAWQTTAPSSADQTNIDTVAGEISPTNNVSTVAGVASDITAVAGEISPTNNVATVAGISTEITSVAGKATEIGRLGTADAVADMAILGTADVVADMNTLGTADVVADLNTLAAISSDISTVAGDSADVSSLASISSDITEVSGISANVTTVANNVAGVNSFGDRYRVGATDPSTSLDEGDLFYNTTSNALKVYNGSAWEQGVTAGSGFLPTTGGSLSGNLSVTGNITVSGNVDGRDVSVDGTKLDGIESNATADQTASEIKTAYESNLDTNALTDALLTKLNGIETSATADQSASEILTAIKTVDGASSGLDADLLDGQQGSYYLNADNFSNMPAGYTGWTISDGTNSESIADGNTLTVSGSGATTASYNTTTNTLTISSTDNNTTYSNATTSTAGLMSSSDKTKIDGIESGATADQSASEILTAIKTVDGAASGLDADLLDGQQGSYYLNANNFSNMPSGYTGWTISDGTNSESIADGNTLTVSGTGATTATYNASTNTLTINSTDTNTDTNTTYTADGNYGMTLSGTTFRLENDRRRNSTTEDVKTGNMHDYVWFDASVGNRFYTAGAEDMRLTNGGDLHVDGNIIAYSTTISDPRLKEDIKPVEDALSKVEQLTGYTFTYKPDGTQSAGVMSTEVSKVLPSAIKTSNLPLVTDGTVDYDVVQYDQLHALLIEAVKELSERVKHLEEK